MAFTYDTTTDLGKVRLQIQDNVANTGILPGGTNFTDAELNVFLDREGSVMRAAAAALETASIRWARKADIGLGSYRESFGQVASALAAQAKLLRNTYGYNAASSAGSVALTRVDGYSDDVAADEL